MVPVSVIIPFYNDSGYFPEMLGSVRAQTQAPAEIVVVDDGSDSDEARRFLAGLDADIRLVRLRSNRGPGVARNAGVEAATQPYIAFLDCDDVWMPHKLESQYGLMAAWRELDMTYTQASYAVGADGLRVSFPSEGKPLLEAVLTNHRMTTPSIMVKRESFERVGGFDPKFRCTQDWDFCIRCVLAGFAIAPIAEPMVVVRRQGHGNHSSNWRCFLAGHLRVVLKHRRAYRQCFGLRPWVHQLAYELYRGGARQGGLLGSLLMLPYRIGV